MNVRPLPKSRRFEVGGVELAHVADIELAHDELITFHTESGSEYDVVRKSWGYYPLPSLNRRLPSHGFRPLLVQASDGRTMLLVCERGHETELERYVSEQCLSLVAWMDGDPCPMCRGFQMGLWHRYDTPPEGETRFDLGGRAYCRELMRCAVCGHFVSVTGFELSSFYEGDYVEATYGDHLSAAYDRVMALPAGESDNVARVDRIVTTLGNRGSVLDVGSGLGVFPARMEQAGWTVTALDPDLTACEHIERRTRAKTINADFLKVDLEGLGQFDLVSFNKVLEHVPDPVGMLARARSLLRPGGVVYVEVPDGEAAANEGPGREEFFIEHLHVFTVPSIGLLGSRAGLRTRCVERLREPSSKYTLFALCDVA